MAVSKPTPQSPAAAFALGVRWGLFLSEYSDDGPVSDDGRLNVIGRIIDLISEHPAYPLSSLPLEIVNAWDSVTAEPAGDVQGA